MPKLFLIPTEFELQKVKSILAANYPQRAKLFEFQLCGFGPIAAAATTMQLLATGPTSVVLLGIAGTYQAERFPIGSATKFNHVICHGVGVGSGPQFTPASELGWQQGPAIGDRLACTSSVTDDLNCDLLTVCSAADSLAEATTRLTKNPTTVGEDMEAFGVAIACHMLKIDFEVIRGFSNIAGDRNKTNWRIDQALSAAVDLLLQN